MSFYIISSFWLITSSLFAQFWTPTPNNTSFSVKKSTHVYAVKGKEELAFDLYQPDLVSDTTKRMALIWMHGGGFAGGTRDNKEEVQLMEMAAKKGYVAISISYRLTRKGKSFSCDASRAEKMETFRAASEDLWDAIAFAADNHVEFNIDTSKMIIGGSSAGAEGVLNAVYMRDWLYEGSNRYEAIKPAMVFSLAGAMIDIRYLNKENAVPAIFFHGTKDNLVPYATAPHHFCKHTDIGYIWLDGSRTIANHLKELDQSYMLYTAVNAGHEMASIPLDKMEMVFHFFDQVINEGKTIQQEYTVFPY